MPEPIDTRAALREDLIAAAWDDACKRKTPWNHGNLSAWEATSFREFARLFAQGVVDRVAAAPPPPARTVTQEQIAQLRGAMTAYKYGSWELEEAVGNALTALDLRVADDDTEAHDGAPQA